MRRTMSRLFLGTLLSFAVAGCSRAPWEELEQVQGSLQRARASEADRYAPEALYEAEAALQSAKLEMDVQGQRFPMGRSYEEANRLLADAKAAAERARDAALSGRDARAALARAVKALSEAEAAIENGPRAKGAWADITEMEAELAEAASALSLANVAFEAGDYAAARAHADAVRARMMSLVADLSEEQKKTT